MEAPKVKPANLTLVLYGTLTTLGLVLGVAIWRKLFNKGGIFDAASKQLDVWATDYGYNKATDALAPRLAYDRARSAFAAANGYKYAQASNPPGWPDFETWVSTSYKSS